MINIVMRLLELFDYKTDWDEISPNETWRAKIDDILINVDLIDDEPIQEEEINDYVPLQDILISMKNNGAKFPLSITDVLFSTRYEKDPMYRYDVVKLERFIAPKIFSAVGNLLTNILPKHGSDIYVFTSEEEPSRTKLYDKLVPLLATKLNNYVYAGKIESTPNRYDFYLIKKQ